MSRYFVSVVYMIGSTVCNFTAEVDPKEIEGMRILLSLKYTYTFSSDIIAELAICRALYRAIPGIVILSHTSMLIHNEIPEFSVN